MDMDTFHVALLQLVPTGDIDGNLDKCISSCRIAKAMGADLALFPEMWHNGYSVSSDPEKLKREVIAQDGPFVRSFQKLAGELEMTIGITFLEVYSLSPRNTLCVFDRMGRLTLKYAKVCTCDFDDE